jgi:DNA-binding transcriptional regulator LsrR (DeoR family)
MDTPALRSRNIFWLYLSLARGMTAAEIARTLNLPEQTVRDGLKAARDFDLSRRAGG